MFSNLCNFIPQRRILTMRQAIFLIRTSDRKGLLAEITGFFYTHNLNILQCRQYTDVRENRYFMRIAIDISNGMTHRELERDFAAIASAFALEYSIYYPGSEQNMAIMVSRASHCLYDLLMNADEGHLDCRIPLIVSNHPDLEQVAQRFRIPFFCFPIEKGRKEDSHHNQSLLFTICKFTNKSEKSKVNIRAPPESCPCPHICPESRERDGCRRRRTCCSPGHRDRTRRATPCCRQRPAR